VGRQNFRECPPLTHFLSCVGDPLRSASVGFEIVVKQIPSLFGKIVLFVKVLTNSLPENSRFRPLVVSTVPFRGQNLGRFLNVRRAPMPAFGIRAESVGAMLR
jgi:hypothetical protein